MAQHIICREHLSNIHSLALISSVLNYLQWETHESVSYSRRKPVGGGFSLIYYDSSQWLGSNTGEATRYTISVNLKLRQMESETQKAGPWNSRLINCREEIRHRLNYFTQLAHVLASFQFFLECRITKFFLSF